MSIVRCPYCLMPTHPKLQRQNRKTVYLCSHSDCALEMPREFVERPDVPRAVVGLVGFSGHGKTVYITALFHLLRVMQNVWRGFYSRGLDSHTIKSFYERIDRFRGGWLPESTPANFPTPSLFHFHEVPHFGEWYLSFYDTAGEIFEDSELVAQQGRFLADSDVAVFIISVTDSGAGWSARIEQLLDTYLNGVYDAMHVDLRSKQHLLVVLSKSDTLFGRIPAAIEGFLMKGAYPWYAEQTSHHEMMSQLQQSSHAIRAWLSHQGCGGFINKAQDNFRSVEYTLVSSTGAAPVGDRLPSALLDEDPRRVLDPFFWVLEKARPRSRWVKLFGR